MTTRGSRARSTGWVLGVVVATVSLVACVEEGDGGERQGASLRARAVIRGGPGSGVTGEVTFVEGPPGRHRPVPGVRVGARVEGLQPGRLHGFHIHERGTCDPPGFTSAGGHFDPGPAGDPSPDANHPFHAGDLPNLDVGKGGVGRLTTVTNRVTLSPGPLSLFDADGSAVVVHEERDQGIPGRPGASGGPRLACGVIRLESRG